MIRQPVLAVIVAAGLVGGLWLPFLTHAPNRVLSGAPIPLGWSLAWLPGAALAACVFAPRGRVISVLAAASALALIAVLLWIAGARARDLAAVSSPAARSSIGAGCWVLLAAAALAFHDAARARGGAWSLLLLAPVAALLWSGALHDVSLLREYATRRDVFAQAVIRHLVLVGGTLLPTLAIGVPLGLLAQRRKRWRGPVFGVLNIVQTIPSIALFGLLMAPLTGIGVGGTGVAPAIVALTLYCLLPIARNTATGLDGVPADLRDAARGMGMTGRQILWRIEAPLAAPVFLSGLRLTTVQAIGLAMVAALIGAGGLGRIMFEGLFANALDLVLLGVIPAVLLALLADAALGAIARRA